MGCSLRLLVLAHASYHDRLRHSLLHALLSNDFFGCIDTCGISCCERCGEANCDGCKETHPCFTDAELEAIQLRRKKALAQVQYDALMELFLCAKSILGYRLPKDMRMHLASKVFSSHPSGCGWKDMEVFKGDPTLFHLSYASRWYPDD